MKRLLLVFSFLCAGFMYAADQNQEVVNQNSDDDIQVLIIKFNMNQIKDLIALAKKVEAHRFGREFAALSALGFGIVSYICDGNMWANGAVTLSLIALVQEWLDLYHAQRALDTLPGFELQYLEI